MDSRVKALIETCGAKAMNLRECVENKIPLGLFDFFSPGFYLPDYDVIVVNEDEARPGLSNVVALHELVHWSGARARLARQHIVQMEIAAKAQRLDLIPSMESIETEEMTAQIGMYYLAVALGLDEAMARVERDRYVLKYERANMVKAEAEGKQAAEWLLAFLQMKQAA